MEAASPPREHLDHLDGLRALLALYVVQRHIELAIWQVWERDSRHSLLYFFRSAHFAVDVFIVVSGFCLFLPVVRNALVLRGGASTFFKRRALRILPPYYASFVISMLALAIVGETSQFTGKNAPTIWHHLLLVHDALSPLLVNRALWSIAVEVHIYLLFPLLVLTWRKWGALATFAWGAPLAAVLAYLVNRTRYSDTSPHYLVLFMFGMVGALVHASPRWQWLRAKAPWAVIGTAIILASFIVRNLRFLPIVPIDVLVGIGGTCLVIGGSVPGLCARLLTWRPLVFVGRFSYSLYLVHLPVLGVVLWLAQPLHLGAIEGARKLLVIVVLAAIAVAASYVFYLVAERPFVSGARRRPEEPVRVGQTTA
jgi:peptidoglycan/LPS O-acetylase OafA/YrhL